MAQDSAGVGGRRVCDPDHAADRARGAERHPERDGGGDRAHGHVAVHPREERLLCRPVRWRRPADRRLEPAGVRRRGRAHRRALPARHHASGRHLLVQRLLRLQGSRLAFARPGVRRPRVRRRASSPPSRSRWAHFNDIGGMRPGSLSPDCTEIFQEGIIVPPVRVAREGVVAEELLRLFYRNSRFPEMVKGDTRASMAAIRLGERRLGELFAALRPRARRRPPSTQLIDETERELRQKLRALVPEGRHAFTDTIDSDGQGHGPIKLRYRLDVDGRAHRARHQRQRRPGAGTGQLPDEPAGAGDGVRLLSAGRGSRDHPQRRRRAGAGRGGGAAGLDPAAELSGAARACAASP